MGLFSAIGAVAGGLLSRNSARRNNNTQINMTREQMDFQERMSNTAHQRQVKDLNAAGINPMLSARLGGASSPQGANVGQLANEGEAFVSSASQIKRLSAETDLIKAQAEKAKAETKETEAKTGKIPIEVEKLKAEIKNIGGMTEKNAEETKLILEQKIHEMTKQELTVITQQEVAQRIKLLKTQAKLNDSQIKKIAAEMPSILLEAEIDQTKYGRAFKYLDRMLPSVNSATNVISAVSVLNKLKNIGNSLSKGK